MHRPHLNALALAIAAALLGCRTEEPSTAPEDPPALVCPERMIGVQGGHFELGEGDAPEHRPNQFNAVIRSGAFDIASFCVDVLPAPNRAGVDWPKGGLGYEDARVVDEALRRHGRRLCRVSELLLAAAGPHNARYPYDPETRREGVCDPSDVAPEPLGKHGSCVSPTGVRDFMVRSAWGRLEPPMHEHLVAYGAPNRPPHLGGGVPTDLDYAVYGGIGRTDTFYASTNFGIHGHDAAEGPTQDDWFRVCRDPGPVVASQEEAHRAWMEAFVASR